MLGRPGSTQDKDIIAAKWEKSRASLMLLIDRMNNMDTAELAKFLSLPMLSEKLTTKRASKVGDFEREFFKEAFFTLYDECDDLSSFEVCWNAY